MTWRGALTGLDARCDMGGRTVERGSFAVCQRVLINAHNIRVVQKCLDCANTGCVGLLFRLSVSVELSWIECARLSSQASLASTQRWCKECDGGSVFEFSVRQDRISSKYGRPAPVKSISPRNR